MKMCIACGMPMNTEADFAMGNKKTAQNAAETMLAKLPAWKEKK